MLAGVTSPLAPSPAWPVREPTLAEDQPLLERASAWKSALDHHSLVEELVATQLRDGFIAHVPGGIDALRV